MFRYDYVRPKILHKRSNSTDNDDSDTNNRDPGREVIEKNTRNRLQRTATQTKEELNIVLKRVDDTLNNYESSVKSSLVQHGMAPDDMANIEYVADIKELENLLNDSLAKKRYQQRLMIFIVGQTEQLDEKTKLLQQISQFFNEQKQTFSSKEFNISDEINEPPNDIDQALKSFDVKDCYVHVRELGTRLTELNEEIIEYLIQNAAAKQQAKGKKKSTPIPKEIKEQLTNLQTKLDTANTDIINRDEKIQFLENEINTIRNEIQTNQDNQKILHNQLNQYELEIKSYKDRIDELENIIEEYNYQRDDLTKIKSTTHHLNANVIQKFEKKDNKSSKIIVSNQTDKEEVQLTTVVDKTQASDSSNEITHYNEQISSNNIEELPDLNVLFNLNNEIDLNDVTTENLPTTFANLRQLAITRITELSKELEIKELINNERIQNLQQEFDEYKIICEKEQNTLIEKANNAYQLQLKAQKTSEEALNQLQLLANEQGKSKISSIHQETQKDIDEETEPIENLLRTSLIEEKQNEMDQIEQQVEIPLTSTEEKIALQPSENRTDNSDDEENQSVIKQDQQQQKSLDGSRRSSEHIEKIQTQTIQTDQFKLQFFQLYDLIYKFRYAIINLLEQHKFTSLADRLQIIQQLSSDNDNNNITSDFIKNSECILKDTVKVLQTCITTLTSTINEYQRKEKDFKYELEPIEEASSVDNPQSSILQEKELMIIDLTTKYEHITKVLNQTNKTNEEKLNQNQSSIHDQQKLIKKLQHELIHLQKRLTKIEAEGIVEPSILFTRLDAERNEQTLQQAVYQGKVHETIYNELNEAMTDYIRLPSQQFSNLVKRYIHYRKAVEIENRIENHFYDHETRNVLEKMESLYERRANQISKCISDIRQQRANLAITLTEKFDNLEDESSIFLIRPVYSYQGRIATQSYMKYEKLRREALLKENKTKKQHHPSRQSLQSQHTSNQKVGKQKISTRIPSIISSDDDEPCFNIEKSFVLPQTLQTDQQNDSNGNNIDTEQKPIKLSELTRLQECDVQRALMPMSHSSTPLLSAFTNDGIDPCVPSLNLRSYVALSRPGIGNPRVRKPSETITRISRDSLSTMSGIFNSFVCLLSFIKISFNNKLAKSRERNPRTPFNSTAGDLKRASPPLPPIKRSLISNISSSINDSENKKTIYMFFFSILLEFILEQHSGLIPTISTNEVSTTN
ncbi:unnamed protein product [Rotaria sp. Silwood1]|nr:unnamed protein product [Rotaria sp. Silwood1]